MVEIIVITNKRQDAILFGVSYHFQRKKKSLCLSASILSKTSSNITLFIMILQLMKNPSTPQRFWLPLLHDSVSNLWKRFGEI